MSPGAALDALCLAGCVLAAAAALGMVGGGLAYAALWLLHLSIANVGQSFLGAGW